MKFGIAVGHLYSVLMAAIGKPAEPSTNRHAGVDPVSSKLQQWGYAVRPQAGARGKLQKIVNDLILHQRKERPLHFYQDQSHRLGHSTPSH